MRNCFPIDVMAAERIDDRTLTENSSFTRVGEMTTWREFVEMVPVTQ